MKSVLVKFNLSKKEINRLSDACRLFSIDCGQHHKNPNDLKSADWQLLDNISHYLWSEKSKKTVAEQIRIGFELFEKFPSYFHFLLPYYRLIKYKQTEDQSLQNIIWQTFMKFLGTENCYFSPVSYVLWVEFFEDCETADETWKGLMQFSDNKISVMKLLEFAGPIAYELKEPVYKKLLPDQSTHESIFKSLLFSSFDLFGKTENDKALKLLSQLKIDPKTEHYQKLREKLKC
jgi:hypothetical protein